MTTKKFFRYCFIILALFIGGLLIVGLKQPKDIVVSRSIIIQAPKEAVFTQMSHFRNWPNWSPWTRLDTTMKNTFAGEDGMPGSTYHWVGDIGKTGEAEFKLTSVNGTSMVYQFDLIKPQHITTFGSLKAEDMAGGTKATFSFTNHFDYPWNAMTIFMNIDNLLSKDFENGLKNMKEYVESHPVGQPN